MAKAFRVKATCSTSPRSTIWLRSPAHGTATKAIVSDRAVRMRVRSSKRTRRSRRSWKPKSARRLALPVRRRARLQPQDQMARRITRHILRNSGQPRQEEDKLHLSRRKTKSRAGARDFVFGGSWLVGDYRPRPNFGWKVIPNERRMLFCESLLKR